ncbi:MAG: hypothetical protein ABI857_13340 [Acidobacteriota bacterium]
MPTVHSFVSGDFLIFQLESGYALLRVLAVDETDAGEVWHLAAYKDLFLDVEAVDEALDDATSLIIEKPHVALTNRAFESTQVARMRNVPLREDDLEDLKAWKLSAEKTVSDRSIRLLLGLR